MTMRENAAKVALDRVLLLKSAEPECKSGITSAMNIARQAEATIIASDIRALPDVPNPTRAALEECVRAAALDIWVAYERHLGNPAHANQDKDSFVLNVSGIIKRNLGE